MQSEVKKEKLVYCKIDPDGVGLIPNYSEDIGIDVATAVDFDIKAKSFISKIPTNLIIHLPSNTYGRIAEKSSLASKGIGVLGGVIDAGYCGEVMVNLFNFSEKNISFSKGERIAQLICEVAKSVKIEEVTNERMIILHTNSERKEKGFGSLK